MPTMTKHGATSCYCLLSPAALTRPPRLTYCPPPHVLLLPHPPPLICFLLTQRLLPPPCLLLLSPPTSLPSPDAATAASPHL